MNNETRQAQATENDENNSNTTTPTEVWYS